MNLKTIPWRSLSAVFSASLLLGFTSTYRSTVSAFSWVWWLFIVVNSVAFFTGIQSSRPAIQALNQIFGNFRAILIAALVIGAGYGGGILIYFVLVKHFGL